MKTISVKATLRRGTGKGVARKLRREGLLPAVIYGGGRPESTSIAIPMSEVRKVKHHHGLINLDIGDEKRTCILKDIQYNFLGDVPIHLDFQEVKFGETITVTVDLEFVGTPIGVSEEGGVLEEILREIQIQTLPRNIPNAIVVDVSKLHVGDVLHVKDLNLPEGVKVLENPDEAVAIVSEKAAEEEAPSEETVPEEETPEEQGEA